MVIGSRFTPLGTEPKKYIVSKKVLNMSNATVYSSIHATAHKASDIFPVPTTLAPAPELRETLLYLICPLYRWQVKQHITISTY